MKRSQRTCWIQSLCGCQRYGGGPPPTLRLLSLASWAISRRTGERPQWVDSGRPLWVESRHWPALSNCIDCQREWIKMRLEAEGKSPVENPSESKVRALVASLKSYGPCSFASITDEQGSYLQVGGGGQSCLLERRDAGENRHFRAYRAERSAVFPDGTVLSFSGGDVPLRSDEWMSAAMVAEAFSAFLERRPLPSEIMWREISELVKAPR